MKNLSDDFLEQAFLNPNNLALFIEENYYSYSEVLAKAKEIYDKLSRCDQQFNRIGIYCTDDFVTYSSIIAISLYGAAFVPINSKFPKEKNEIIILSSEIEVVLYNSQYDLNFDLNGINSIAINDNFQKNNLTLAKCDFVPQVEQPLAYILFTSGTTGQPKGVPISKMNVTAFFDFFKTQEQFNFTHLDRFIQVFELTFDVSIFSFFMPLSTGASCYVLPQKGIKFIEIIKMLNEHEITVAIMVPTVLQFMEKYIEQIDFPKLKYSIFCGDKLLNRIAEKWASVTKNAQLYNCYGPTETTIICTYYLWKPDINKLDLQHDVVSFGKNFSDVKSIIVDENNKIVYDEGELCFHGKQIITSYLNNCNPDKFFINNGVTYYKTGDKVKVNELGNYLFLGRTDNQLKINGYRVELFEIEETIRSITDSKFVIFPLIEENKLTQLILFIEGNNENSEELKKNLNEKLPFYMIPNQIIYIDNIPLNLNHKYDLNKLKTYYFKE